jgi:hypothetical protein
LSSCARDRQRALQDAGRGRGARARDRRGGRHRRALPAHRLQREPRLRRPGPRQAHRRRDPRARRRHEVRQSDGAATRGRRRAGLDEPHRLPRDLAVDVVAASTARRRRRGGHPRAMVSALLPRTLVRLAQIDATAPRTSAGRSWKPDLDTLPERDAAPAGASTPAASSSPASGSRRSS